jgi:hypothetical protein
MEIRVPNSLSDFWTLNYTIKLKSMLVVIRPFGKFPINLIMWLFYEKCISYGN